MGAAKWLVFLVCASFLVGIPASSSSIEEVAKIAVRLHGKSDNELWKEMQAIAAEKAEKKGWELLENAGEKALGTKIKKSDAAVLLKTLEAASAGDWEAAAKEGGQAIIAAYIPIVGQYIAALSKANEFFQAAIQEWVEDLYRHQAYLWLEREVEAHYQSLSKIDGFHDKADPYLPSYRLQEGGGEQKKAREFEAKLFARWSESTKFNVQELHTRFGSRIRQVLKKMPTDREIFNHFYHRITRQNLPRYQKTYTTIRSDQLSARSDAAKRELLRAFRARLDAIAGARSGAEAISLRGYLDDYGGLPIPGQVANGAILAFEAAIAYPALETPPVTTLEWAVMDSSGNPVVGLEKREQVAVAGEEKVHRFKFQPESLPNGDYQVMLSLHSPGSPPKVRKGAMKFRIFQQVMISRLVVAASSDAERSLEFLNPDQAPMLFAYFTAEDRKAKVVADLSVLDPESGSIIAQQSTELDKKQKSGERRVGLGLDPGSFPIDRKLIFRAALASEGGSPHTKEIAFSVKPFVAAIRFSKYGVQAGEAVGFSILAPPRFKAPFRVSLTAQGGAAHMESDLEGILTPDSSQAGRNARLGVAIVDSEGRSANTSGEVYVVPPQAPAAPPPAATQAASPPPKATPAAPVGSAEPAGLDLSEALAKFQQDMGAALANKQAGDEAANRKQQQEWDAFRRQQQGGQGAAGVKNYYALVSHSVIPGRSVSTGTSNSCRVVQGKPSLPCGFAKCGTVPFSGAGAELCRPMQAFTSFSRFVGPMDAAQAQAYCGQVAADPRGLGVATGASSNFFCF